MQTMTKSPYLKYEVNKMKPGPIPKLSTKMIDQHWMLYKGKVASVNLLGLRIKSKKLFINPCIPSTWARFELSFRYHSSRYEVNVENPKSVCRGVQSSQIDEKPISEMKEILVADDGGDHRLRIVLG